METAELVEFCSFCKERLVRKPWNAAVDILLCENGWCFRYLQPQGCIQVPPRSMKEVVALLEKGASERIRARDATRGLETTTTIKERKRKR